MTCTPVLGALASLLLVACSVPDEAPGGDTDEATVDEAPLTGEAKSDSASGDGWERTATLHAGDRVFDHAAIGSRRVHPLWAAGSEGAPVPVVVTVSSTDETPVRVAVLGPLDDAGHRAVLGASGYSARETSLEVPVLLTATGQHLIVVGSYALASEVTYQVDARCAPDAGDACGADRLDLLATPKVAALSGGVGDDPADLLRAELGLALADRLFDVEMEVWAAPPARLESAQLVGVSEASGNQINAIVPPGVAVGDDLILVLREAGGDVLDSGVVTRYAPDDASFARLDSVLYGDLVSVEVSGVTGYFEGVAELALRSVDRGHEVARVALRADRPGQIGMGLSAFDVTFAPALTVGDTEVVNPDLPTNGELLSVGTIGGNGAFAPLGCFQYCNDLSGNAPCTGGPRACP